MNRNSGNFGKAQQCSKIFRIPKCCVHVSILPVRLTSSSAIAERQRCRVG